MAERLKYRKKPDQYIVAVQLDLETNGFTYRKWGGIQNCNRGDWIVNNNGNIYTITEDSFRKTYKALGAGRYIKTATVWAEVATQAGTISTKEGTTTYLAGDYVVFNDEEGQDSYAISREEFEAMYELCDEVT